MLVERNQGTFIVVIITTRNFRGCFQMKWNEMKPSLLTVFRECFARFKQQTPRGSNTGSPRLVAGTEKSDWLRRRNENMRMLKKLFAIIKRFSACREENVKRHQMQLELQGPVCYLTSICWSSQQSRGLPLRVWSKFLKIPLHLLFFAIDPPQSGNVAFSFTILRHESKNNHTLLVKETRDIHVSRGIHSRPVYKFNEVAK